RQTRRPLLQANGPGMFLAPGKNQQLLVEDRRKTVLRMDLVTGKLPEQLARDRGDAEEVVMGQSHDLALAGQLHKDRRAIGRTVAVITPLLVSAFRVEGGQAAFVRTAVANRQCLERLVSSECGMDSGWRSGERHNNASRSLAPCEHDERAS